MSYLRFDKTLMTNLEDSLPKEVLRSNRSGAYSCSTIVDCNTRKYHGLLVVPVPELDQENHVLLSSLDATVIQHGAVFNLGLHKYGGDNFSPRGHKYIREFDSLQVPTTIYRVGGVILKREQMFQHFENRIIIRYTLVDAHSETTLRLQPFLAFRSVREYTHENSLASREYDVVEGGIKTCMYEGYPDLYMQIDKKNEFVYAPTWYKGVEYPKEQERGYASNEDLYVPGYFEFKIKKGESVVFSAGLTEIETKKLAELAEFEVNIRTPRDNFYNTLVNSAHQFIVHREHEDYVLAGYPWFKCRARDQFIALPGLTLTNNELKKYDDVMETSEKAIRSFMKGEELGVSIQEIEQPDVLLWAVWCIQQYGKFVSMDECIKKYGRLVEDIMEWLRGNNHPNLKVMENGLVYSEGRDKAVTWMNSTANGRPIVPRTGYIVEFNALWYNALKFAVDICTHVGDAKNVKMLSELAEKVGRSFNAMFWNEHGYLCDYCVDGYRDYLVRPNMIFAVAFDHSPLDKKQQKSVLDYCTKELITPKGMRSLSPKSSGYNPMYVGPQVQRDYAYHQGTAWPWLAGFYMEATLKVHKYSRVSYVDRLLVGYEEELFYHCIGTIPELFDGNPPFHGRGAISFAMNVAEIMRVVKLLDQYNEY
ncbi:MAG: glycogen debranching enzyme family protein [Bacteroidaceae bacterium]|nr:glycogen debranching enzyme family protein [Bacteroidaceae bacterium]MBR6846235.1 glycogen debranching enzyme family protein [Bacteroidaceae bacterium]